MEKEDILKALRAYLAKDENPSLPDYYGISQPCFHSEEWIVGGIGGGSCWNDGDEGRYHDLLEQESQPIKNLEKFLDEFYPHLSLSQYKELILHVKNDYWTHYEYYGNYTDYACAYLTFEDITNVLLNIKKPVPTKIYR